MSHAPSATLIRLRHARKLLGGSRVETNGTIGAISVAKMVRCSRIKLLSASVTCFRGACAAMRESFAHSNIARPEKKARCDHRGLSHRRRTFLAPDCASSLQSRGGAQTRTRRASHRRHVTDLQSHLQSPCINEVLVTSERTDPQFHRAVGHATGTSAAVTRTSATSSHQTVCSSPRS